MRRTLTGSTWSGFFSLPHPFGSIDLEPQEPGGHAGAGGDVGANGAWGQVVASVASAVDVAIRPARAHATLANTGGPSLGLLLGDDALVGVGPDRHDRRNTSISRSCADRGY
jgi:hypothetical protein